VHVWLSLPATVERNECIPWESAPRQFGHLSGSRFGFLKSLMLFSRNFVTDLPRSKAWKICEQYVQARCSKISVFVTAWSSFWAKRRKKVTGLRCPLRQFGHLSPGWRPKGLECGMFPSKNSCVNNIYLWPFLSIAVFHREQARTAFFVL